jgi:hypothetical protein
MDERTNSVMDTAPCARAQRNVVAGRALQLHRVFEHQHAVARGGNLGQQRIGERGLAATGGARDQDVLALAHGANEKARVGAGHHSVDDVPLQQDHADGALAQREGRPRCCRWQDALKAFSGFGQLGGQQRFAAMHFRTDVGGDQPNDPFAICLGQFHTHRCAPADESRSTHKGAIRI